MLTIDAKNGKVKVYLDDNKKEHYFFVLIYNKDGETNWVESILNIIELRKKILMCTD